MNARTNYLSVAGSAISYAGRGVVEMTTLAVLAVIFTAFACALWWAYDGLLGWILGRDNAAYFVLMAVPLLLQLIPELFMLGFITCPLVIGWLIMYPVDLPFFMTPQDKNLLLEVYIGVQLAITAIAAWIPPEWWNEYARFKKSTDFWRTNPVTAGLAQGDASVNTTTTSASGQALKYSVASPTLKFQDVVGMDDLKKRLLNAGQIIKDSAAPNPKKPTTMKPRNGILLHGLPGNGKTLFVEALAGELGLPFLRATFGDMASKWVNETTENVTQLFKDAKAQAPCLLFIDEIDSLLVKRDNARSSDSESTKTVNALLTELVDLRKFPIVLVAATNYLDQLDPTAIREGRFDFKIEVPPPDQAARQAIIRATLAKHGVTATVADDTLKTAAARWSGYSAARITAVIEELTTTAENQTSFDLNDFMTALRTIQGRKGNISEGTKTLDQMHFPESVATQLNGIANRMRKIEEVEALGGTVPAGILFFGPPGTGKTATARALAKTTGWAFLSVSGNDLLSNASRIDDVLKEASELRPCIVFIDEADDVLAERGSNSYASSVTNKLLTAIDGADGKVPDVMFIAATNLPDAMDSAALRGGRFTEKIEFMLPDRRTLEAFIADWMKNTRAKIAETFDPATAGTFLEGQAIANVREILQQAVNLMVERKLGGADAAAVTLGDVRCAAESIGQFQSRPGGSVIGQVAS
jgi:transitional endoplasmic reticulum ATPase